MMILRTAAASPFGRKVKIAAATLGLLPQISIVDADTSSESDPIRQQNPLGKIPTLVLEDGTALYDSRVIVEYLDHLGGGMLVPAAPADRFRALTLQALADGICDAALLQVYETRWRTDDRREPKWVAHHAAKVARSLAVLERSVPGVTPDIGAIALACALGYLDLRFAGAWRAEHSNLVAWLDAFAAKAPAFELTKVRS